MAIKQSHNTHFNTLFIIPLQVCKHFLDAIESNKYGWFWVCPGGDGCMYRHALPAGFVLKKDKKKDEKEEEKISLEELIENEVQHGSTSQMKTSHEQIF